MPVVAEDHFGRSVTDGMGSADVGGVYTLHAASTRYQVSGGVASITTPAESLSHASLADVAAKDFEGLIKMNLPNSGQDDAYGGIIFRGNAAVTNYYAAVAYFDASGINLIWYYSGYSIATNPVTPGIGENVQDPSDVVWLRAQCLQEGVATRLRARIWLDGNQEPGTWHIDETDSDGPQSEGRVGLFKGTLVSQFIITYDDLTIWTPQRSVYQHARQW